MNGGLGMYDFQDKMKLFENNKVVNWHEHIWFDDRWEMDEERCDWLVKSACRTHMDKLVCSLPLMEENPTPDMIRKCNDMVAKAMKKYPGIIKGLAFVNPGYVKEALYEIDRCIDDLGMIGVKLYNQYFISDPVVHSVIEKCIELDIPILEHAGKLNFEPESQPFISDGTHFAKVAVEYPEAVIIEAHVGGGGDWQWPLKAIEDSPNIFIDTSGSVYDDGLIEETVRRMGADRVLFGTDGSFSAGIGKILGAEISEQDKIKILNNKKFERYLQRGL